MLVRPDLCTPITPAHGAIISRSGRCCRDCHQPA
jgi:hypothetical protein